MRSRARLSGTTPHRGFSLIEVLVALIVLSVGLLGIAKMQALALSSTAVATRRALAAIEAASLADSMHVNRGYWASTASSVASISVSGSTVTNLPVAPAPDCTSTGSAPCGSAGLAAYDLQQWATSLQTLLPGDTAAVSCNTSTPVDCLITINWSEQTVSMSNAQAQVTPGSGLVNPTYVLYVEP